MHPNLSVNKVVTAISDNLKALGASILENILKQKRQLLAGLFDAVST